MNRRILVAGVGNVFFGDDGFGVEVARRLASESWPAGVSVQDYGIRGLHLAYDLLDPVDLLVVVDALHRGDPPGTVTLLEPDLEDEILVTADAHGMNLPVVFSTVSALGGTMPPVRIVGCQPASVGEAMGLSPVVAAAVDPAATMIRTIISQDRTPAGTRENAVSDSQEIEP